MVQGKRSQRRQKRSKRNIFINIIATLLIIVALALIFNAQIRNMIMVWHTNQYQVSKVSKESIDKNKNAETSFDFNKVESLSTEAVINAQWKAQQLPVIGGISIPEVSMNLPIFKGLDNAGLYYGAGTMKESQQMGQGNYALASHHVFGITGASDMLFSPLDRAKAGMKIYITDKEKVYTYVITSVETVTPDRIDVIDDTEGVAEITLVTCEDAAATNRTIVKGTLEGSIEYDKAPKEVLESFSKSYNQMQI
ncbi:Sortase A, LPXTG specific [Streptococcus sp. DD11]|uniref:class A sortase n=1 Tax=Streptococcus sp. DD11 TaxID=1777879 RepID=UPI00079996FE|nr:class A sortase [Streptococcus sp. DD11]KXT78879.1 Sortase A, LPXTG specific [Streptococcus sp. DD11]